MIRSFSSFVLILALSVGAAGTKADDWLRFRGPNGQGQVDGKFPLEWSADENIKWRTPLPAPGNSL